MAGESTFDVVSKVDKQEVANALNQAQKELAQRYDFKGVGAEVDFSGEKILMKANSEERVLAVLDVLQSKLIRRGISLKSSTRASPTLPARSSGSRPPSRKALPRTWRRRSTS